MKIPNKLKVGGFVYKIIKNWKFIADDNAMAEAHHSILEIWLAGTSATSGEKYHSARIEESFIHEILHCVDEIYNGNKTEEQSINRLSQGLYQVLKDNNLLR